MVLKFWYEVRKYTSTTLMYRSVITLVFTWVLYFHAIQTPDDGHIGNKGKSPSQSHRLWRGIKT